MFDTTSLVKNVSSFDSAPQFDGFSMVINEPPNGEGESYYWGYTSGRKLTISCPWGNTRTARNIFEQIEGFQYQPYSATGAIIDPAAELGDGVTIGGLYSGIYSEDIDYGPLLTANIEAPYEEEINHKFKFIPENERAVNRRLRNLSSSLTIQADKIEAEVTERKASDEVINSTLTTQADQISAKVEKTGGDEAGYFGWTLENDRWRITANGSTVLEATQHGLEVTGRIVATSGKIGGFDITDSDISYNNATWGGYNTYGIYLGPDGIQLGSWDQGFRVDNAGNLTCSSGTFRGSVSAGNIEFGGADGYFDGAGLESNSVTGGWDGEIDSYTIGIENCDNNIEYGVAGGNLADDVFNYGAPADYLNVNSLSTGLLGIDGSDGYNHDCYLGYIKVNGQQKQVVMWY